ncbi:FAD-binding oxidoreductase, partial [Candidatus Bipolaricaulota bacterium]|nr:FAD-binding oxidoreductase [Candidatus Bipolaricaulota bacterium]
MELDVKGALAAIVGDEHVSDRMADRICYSKDCGPDKAGIPAVVVRPKSTEEVSSIVRWANEHRHPIYTRGRATTFLGSGVKDDVIMLETTRMDRIETIDLEAGYVTAQCGAIWHGIDAVLHRDGWELAVPGGGGLFSCTIGGTVAVNAIPHGATEYGMTGDHVLALEVVLPTGEIIKTGSAANPSSAPIERGSNGPDLTGIFIGAYGILGIITSVTYRLRKTPEIEKFRFYSFDNYEDAVDAAEGVQAQGAATFAVALFGGPKPTGEDGDAFLHLVVRDRAVTADARIREAEAICASHRGR